MIGPLLDRLAVAVDGQRQRVGAAQALEALAREAAQVGAAREQIDDRAVGARRQRRSRRRLDRLAERDQRQHVARLRARARPAPAPAPRPCAGRAPAAPSPRRSGRRRARSPRAARRLGAADAGLLSARRRASRRRRDGGASAGRPAARSSCGGGAGGAPGGARAPARAAARRRAAGAAAGGAAERCGATARRRRRRPRGCGAAPRRGGRRAIGARPRRLGSDSAWRRRRSRRPVGAPHRWPGLRRLSSATRAALRWRGRSPAPSPAAMLRDVAAVQHRHARRPHRQDVGQRAALDAEARVVVLGLQHQQRGERATARGACTDSSITCLRRASARSGSLAAAASRWAISRASRALTQARSSSGRGAGASAPDGGHQRVPPTDQPQRRAAPAGRRRPAPRRRAARRPARCGHTQAGALDLDRQARAGGQRQPARAARPAPPCAVEHHARPRQPGRRPAAARRSSSRMPPTASTSSRSTPARPAPSPARAACRCRCSPGGGHAVGDQQHAGPPPAFWPAAQASAFAQIGGAQRPPLAQLAARPRRRSRWPARCTPPRPSDRRPPPSAADRRPASRSAGQQRRQPGHLIAEAQRARGAGVEQHEQAAHRIGRQRRRPAAARAPPPGSRGAGPAAPAAAAAAPRSRGRA